MQNAKHNPINKLDISDSCSSKFMNYKIYIFHYLSYLINVLKHWLAELYFISNISEPRPSLPNSLFCMIYSNTSNSCLFLLFPNLITSQIKESTFVYASLSSDFAFLVFLVGVMPFFDSLSNFPEWSNNIIKSPPLCLNNYSLLHFPHDHHSSKCNNTLPLLSHCCPFTTGYLDE